MFFILERQFRSNLLFSGQNRHIIRVIDSFRHYEAAHFTCPSGGKKREDVLHSSNHRGWLRFPENNSKNISLNSYNLFKVSFALIVNALR